MNRKKMGTATIAVTSAILIVVSLFLALTMLHRDRAQIVLPPENTSSDSSGAGNGEGNQGLVSKVEVTPETVQNVIATLARPEAYMRTLTVTTFWSGGEGTAVADTYVSGGYLRTDLTLPGGQKRHTIRTPEQTYIWYNRETKVHTAPNGAFSADEEQWLPTYEDLLALPEEAIEEAAYESYQELDCIYACAQAGDYLEKYWVSVDTGLLVAAEKVKDDAVVYRMEAPAVTLGEPDAGRFTLPDGTVLHRTENE